MVLPQKGRAPIIDQHLSDHACKKRFEDGYHGGLYLQSLVEVYNTHQRIDTGQGEIMGSVLKRVTKEGIFMFTTSRKSVINHI